METLYLMIHSIQLLLYGVRYVVKDHSENERQNLQLPFMGLSFQLEYFMCITGLFTPVVAHWLEQNATG